MYNFVAASNQPAGTTAQYYETKRSIYNGAASGTPVLARNTCYNGNTSPCTTTTFALPISQIDTYQTLDGVETSGTTTTYDSYGNLTASKMYNFGTSSTRGSLLREVDFSYNGPLVGLVTEKQIKDGSGNLAGDVIFAYDQTTPTASSGVPQHTAGINYGNLTAQTLYANASTTYSTTNTYEDTGSLLTTTGPTGITSLGYDSTFVYNTGVTLPTPSSGVSLATGAGFDTSYTGLPTSYADANNNKVKITSYDDMLRPTNVAYPDGGNVEIEYTPTTLESISSLSSSTTTTNETVLDGYGRVSRALQTNGQSSNPWYQSDSCYDANGNLSYQSLAYHGTGPTSTKYCANSATSPGAKMSYDVLGRVATIVRGDGTTAETTTYTYKGRATQVVDPNGVTRISQIDGLGRPSIVCEITSATYKDGVKPASCGTDIAGTGFTTSYSYALSSGTTTITQGAQTRTLVSDWLGRPTQVTEPESGITTYAYSYNATGLVVTRKRPKANQTSSTTLTTTTTQYDTLGRVVSVTYDDGTPTKTYAYDKAAGANFTDLSQANIKGRLSLAAVSNAQTAYSYDTMGRIKYLDECLPSGCGTVSKNHELAYGYDLSGNLLSSTDGGGVTSTYTVSPAGELTSLTSSKSDTYDPAAIISGVVNSPNGPTAYTLGNNLSAAYTYDALGRLSGGWVCSGSPSAYCSSGTQIYGFTAAWSGSQLVGSADTVLNQSSTYVYDDLNRLVTNNVVTGTAPSLSWDYDRYGNRWDQTVLSGTAPNPSFSFNSANNRISTGTLCATPTASAYCYDAAGEMTADTSHTYTFDAEGRIVKVDGGATASYVYDALDHRVRSTVGSTITEFLFNQTGQRVSEWNGSTGTLLKGKYLAGARAIGYYDGKAHFEHQDWLGTERMRTAYNGAVEGTFTSLPWGDNKTVTGTDTDSAHYAQLDYDKESNTDHAQYRQHSSAQGRWLSPDRYTGSYNMLNPQSMNRYAYASNNPLARVDTLGLDDSDPCDDSDDDSCDGGGDGGGGDGGGGDGGGGDGGGGGFYGSPGDTPPNGYTPCGTNSSDGRTIYCDANGNMWIGNSDTSDSSSNSTSDDPNDVPLPSGPSNNWNLVPCGGTVPRVPCTPPIPLPSWKQVKAVAKWYICGSSPADNVKNWMLEGAAKGFVVGSIGGGFTGAILGAPILGVGAIPAAGIGAFVGGVVDGTVGAGAGILWGSAASFGCSLAGAYQGGS